MLIIEQEKKVICKCKPINRNVRLIVANDGYNGYGDYGFFKFIRRAVRRVGRVARRIGRGALKTTVAIAVAPAMLVHKGFKVARRVGRGTFKVVRRVGRGTFKVVRRVGRGALKGAKYVSVGAIGLLKPVRKELKKGLNSWWVKGTLAATAIAVTGGAAATGLLPSVSGGTLASAAGVAGKTLIPIAAQRLMNRGQPQDEVLPPPGTGEMMVGPNDPDVLAQQQMYMQAQAQLEQQATLQQKIALQQKAISQQQRSSGMNKTLLIAGAGVAGLLGLVLLLK